jgi:hypothetical protein
VRNIAKCVALLCLVLTFWSAVAVATHHHSNAAGSAKCTVCVAAHTASPGAAHVATATFTAVSTFRSEPLFFKERVLPFALSVRPPPSV